MERNLEVRLIYSMGVIEVQIYDPESGDQIWKDFMYSPDEHPEFNDWVGNELYDWLMFMEEETE